MYPKIRCDKYYVNVFGSLISNPQGGSGMRQLCSMDMGAHAPEESARGEPDNYCSEKLADRAVPPWDGRRS